MKKKYNVIPQGSFTAEQFRHMKLVEWMLNDEEFVSPGIEGLREFLKEKHGKAE